MGLKNSMKKLYNLTKQKNVVSIPGIIRDKQLLEGKVALISGGSGGIGFAMVKNFLESGCKVILAGTNREKMEQIFVRGSENLRIMVLTFGDCVNFDEKINEAVRFWGRIDIYVNSAGVHTENVNFWDMNAAEYDRVMNINLRGPFFICQSVGRYMIENHIKGHILLVSSSRGYEPAWTPYGLSKWGLNGLVLGLAEMLLPYGIIVNGIAPGSTATELLGIREGDNLYTTDNGLERLALPEEVAEYAKLLVSDLGNMLAGETIRISGGRGVFDIR